VYGTEHMLSLAEGVMDLNIPVVLVIPLSLSYTLLDGEGSGGGENEEGGPEAVEEVAEIEEEAEPVKVEEGGEGI